MLHWTAVLARFADPEGTSAGNSFCDATMKLSDGMRQRNGNGSLYEMDITTNRVDAMNHYGVAREAAAIYGLALPELDFALPKAREGAAAYPVKIEARMDRSDRFMYFVQSLLAPEGEDEVGSATGGPDPAQRGREGRSGVGAGNRMEIGVTGGVETNGRMESSDPNVNAVGDAAETMHALTGERGADDCDRLPKAIFQSARLPKARIPSR